ncbi:hypothetical protein [Halobacterium sp. R2-5]|uniref:DUF7344 domain-containing protein n=1 Tax=Halobacterium sp. R2-5 TaxID=2715751 RepID=UPI0014241B75|nr:hypothetical protein [Halobacterium sp. R2-5]NIB98046.1 hypothetical protein [Halobacterium sp. R2-5]
MSNTLENTEVSTTVARCLARSRRRYVLHRLNETETPLALADLAEDIVDWEADSSQADSAEGIKRVQVALHHVHLPMLAEADLVEYDAAQRAVKLADCPQELFEGDQGLPAVTPSK